MKTISDMCAILVVLDIIAIPVLFIIFIIRACMKKTKKWFGIAIAICAACVLPLALIGTYTDPATYCEHDYSVVEEIAPTCTKRGEVVKVCDLCEREDVEYIDKVDHIWETDSVVDASCIKSGYTEEFCEVCNTTRKTDSEPALGHDMIEISRKEATQDAKGEIVSKCSRCDKEEITTIPKLPKDDENTEPSVTESNPTEPSVTYKDIYKAFQSNELVAEELYKGNRYQITASIYEIYAGGLLGWSDGVTLWMQTNVEGRLVWFYADFDKNQKESLKKVVVGDIITFEGTCVSESNWKKCELIE